MGGGWVDISYCVNGYQCGTAFKVRWNSDEALYPHILTKNCRIEVNFGQAHNPYFSILPGYKFIGNTPPEARVFGAKPPLTKQECEIIMMVGLPGVGKTTWAMNYAKLHSNKKYNILGTDAIIDKMRVQGLPRKENFGGRWDVLIKQATECFNVMLRKASTLNRNLILDQTNVYASARKRKAKQYKDAGYRVHAMVLVPTDDEMISRSKHRTATEGKEVPEAAINDMKANFSLPHEKENLFTTITFLELQRVDAENLVMQYNMDSSMKGYKSNKQSGFGGNENQKEKFEKLQFNEPPPQPPTMLISSSSEKGNLEGNWQRTDSRPQHNLNPSYHKNTYYDQPEKKEHIPHRSLSSGKGNLEEDWQRTDSRPRNNVDPTYHKNAYHDQSEKKELTPHRSLSSGKGNLEENWQRTDSRPRNNLDPTYRKNAYHDQSEKKEHIPPGNTTFREPRDINRNSQSSHQWSSYEDKDESSWWDKSNVRNQGYGYRNSNDMPYPEENFRSPPSLMRSMEQNNHGRQDQDFNERREQPWHMDRHESTESPKICGGDQRRSRDNNSSFSTSQGHFESPPFPQNNQRSTETFNPPWQEAERNQSHQGRNFEESRRPNWNNEIPSQKGSSHQEIGNFSDNNRPHQWEQRRDHHDMHDSRWAAGDQQMNYGDSFKQESGSDGYGDSYGHKQIPPNYDFGRYPPKGFRNDEDRFSGARPEQVENQHPDYEFERKQFESRNDTRNNYNRNRQGPRLSESTERPHASSANQRGALLDTLSSNLSGVDFDDLRATLANVRQQALQGKNALLDYHDQVDESYPRGQSSLEPHNQRARQPISNQMDREGAYFREPDLGRRAEEQHSQSGVENYSRSPDSNSRMNPQPLLQHDGDARRNSADRYRNEQYDRNRGKPDERFPKSNRNEINPASDKKATGSDRNYSRSERRDVPRDSLDSSSSRKDRRRSQERSSQSRVSGSRSVRNSRDDYRDKDDSRRRKSSPRRYPPKRSERSSGKDRDDFGRDPKQRRCARSPDRGQRDVKDVRAGRDGKTSTTAKSSSRERERSSGKGNRHNRSPEIKPQFDNERVSSRSSLHEKRDGGNVSKKPLLRRPNRFEESGVTPMRTETKFERGPQNEADLPKVQNMPRGGQQAPDKRPLLATPPFESIATKPLLDRRDETFQRQKLPDLSQSQQGDKFGGPFELDLDMHNQEQHWTEEPAAANQNMHGDGLLGPCPSLPHGSMNIPDDAFEEKPPSIFDLRPPLLHTPTQRFGDPRLPFQRGPRPRFPPGNRPPRFDGMAMRPRMRPVVRPGGQGFPGPFNIADPRFGAMHEPAMMPGNNPRFSRPRHPMHRGPRPMRPGQPRRMPLMPRPGPPRPIRM